MPLVVVDTNMVRLWMPNGQAIGSLTDSEILEEDHVDGADEVALLIIGQKQTLRRGCRAGVERAETRHKIGQLDEQAHALLVAPAQGFRPRL
jgi:hypothetical protein